MLLPDTRTPGDSWLDRRSHDLRLFDPGFTPDLLKNQVRSNMDYIAQATRAQPHVELGSFNLPNTCQVIATDRAAYLTFYSRSSHGRNSPCLYT